MTPQQFRAVMKDLLRHSEGEEMPICAFSLRNGQIYTGHWEPLTTACQVITVTLVTKEAPPIYIGVESIDAVAVDGAA